MNDAKQPAKRGRKPLPAGEAKTARVEVRLTPAHKAEFLALGGGQWLERQIEAAKRR